MRKKRLMRNDRGAPRGHNTQSPRSKAHRAGAGICDHMFHANTCRPREEGDAQLLLQSGARLDGGCQDAGLTFLRYCDRSIVGIICPAGSLGRRPQSMASIRTVCRPARLSDLIRILRKLIGAVDKTESNDPRADLGRGDQVDGTVGETEALCPASI